MMRSRLSKAFFAWKDRFGLMDQNFAMRRKLQRTINKGRMRRAFLGWRKVTVQSSLISTRCLFEEERITL